MERNETGDGVRSRAGATAMSLEQELKDCTLDLGADFVRDKDGNLQDKQCVGDEPTPTETPTPSVYISGFHPSSIPADDYVTVFNSTTDSFNLTGWWMKAESESGRYDFPTNFVLSAGASVNVRSGVGTDTTTNLISNGMATFSIAVNSGSR